MATCPHGFNTDDCMICRTLDVAGAARAVAQSQTGRGRKGRRAAQVTTAVPAAGINATLGSSSTAALPEVRAQGGNPGSRGRSFLALVGLIAVGGLCLWAFTGLFSLAFHVGEFVAVALVAGWVGYKVGHFRGRRRH